MAQSQQQQQQQRPPGRQQADGGDEAPAPQAATRQEDKEQAQVWTRLLEQLHGSHSLDAALQCAEDMCAAAATTRTPRPPPRDTVRRPGGAAASQASALVDALERLGHCLQQQHGGSPPSNHISRRRGGKPPPLSPEQLRRVQAAVQALLQALVPLLRAEALPPKRLASLARAVNTLAAFSPATNSRQRPTAQASSSGPGAPPASSSDAAAALPSLPQGWAQAYAHAASRALPAASPAALCYLLRALCLDRAKRLLRASRWLSPALAPRVQALAPRMEGAQAVVALSCAAQLAWHTQPALGHAWLQVKEGPLLCAVVVTVMTRAILDPNNTRTLSARSLAGAAGASAAGRRGRAGRRGAARGRRVRRAARAGRAAPPGPPRARARRGAAHARRAAGHGRHHHHRSWRRVATRRP